MASITLRNIDENLKTKLRQIAADNKRSMEEEARQILRQHLLKQKSSQGIGTRIAKRFAEAGGVEMSDIPRSKPKEPPDFSSEEY